MDRYTALIHGLGWHDDLISRCGTSVLFLLETGFHHLVADPAPLEATRDGFTTLLHLAEEKINTLPFHAVGAEWLRLYVDATIGLVVAQVLAHDGTTAAPWREWIRKLDMAIIIAGAVGHGRDDAIQRLITLVQADYAADHLARYRRVAEQTTDVMDGSARKRRRTSGHEIHYAPSPVPEHPALSTTVYRTTHHTTPFIIRRFSSPASCPAITHWRSAGYLLSLVGPGRVVPVEIGASYTAREWGQRIVPFEVFLSRIGYDLSGLVDDDDDDDSSEEKTTLPPGQPLYLAQHALLDQFPQLKPDVGPLPDYIYSSPDAPDYAPPGNEQGLIMNVWVGNGAGAFPDRGDGETTRNGASSGPVISPAHTDPYFNCYLQILGNKRVWLAPPDVSDFMYAFPDPETQDDEAGHVDADEDGLVTSYTTNTSRVPIFDNPDRHCGPAYERRYQRFYDRAFPHSVEAVLEPGDLLVMPPKWWHAMRSEGDGVAWSLSMWY